MMGQRMRTMARCECKVGPGKFEGEGAATFMAWEQVMLGNSDATTGDEGENVDWLRAPLNLDADAEVVKAALAYGYCEACVDKAGQDLGGIKVWEDSSGFVYCREYATVEAFDKALAKAEAMDAQEAEEAGAF